MNQLLEENFDKFELKLTKDKNISKSDATRKRLLNDENQWPGFNSW